MAFEDSNFGGHMITFSWKVFVAAQLNADAERKKHTLSIKILWSPSGACDLHTPCGYVFILSLPLWIDFFFL